MLIRKANHVDPDQTAPQSTGTALFAYDFLSETLGFEILGHLRYPKDILVDAVVTFSPPWDITRDFKGN